MCRVGPLRYMPESIRYACLLTRARALRALRPDGPPPTMITSKSVWGTPTGGGGGPVAPRTRLRTVAERNRAVFSSMLTT